MARLPLLLTLCAALSAVPAAATEFGRFQHGGRGTAQAGAFVARADDPSAVAINPAALTRLEGLQVQFGLDFDSPTLTARSTDGEHRAAHSIQFPPAGYLTWRSEDTPFALGLSVDTPLWRFADWDTRRFPERFTARRSEARLLELRAAAAVELGSRWSLGLALRAAAGEVGYGDTRAFTVDLPDGSRSELEIDRLAEADADGFGLELGAHYVAPRWGLGATWRSALEVEGSGRLDYLVSDPASVPVEIADAARAALPRGRSTLREELPERWSGGVWWGVTPALTVELDAEWSRWSAASPAASHEPARIDTPFALGRRGDWDDTLSLRLGIEWRLSDAWSFGAGLAHEPSPLAPGAVEPGMPVGDLQVASLGASWSMGWLTFDVGWSMHDSDTVRARDQLPQPGVLTTYSARAQVWAASARWKF